MQFKNKHCSVLLQNKLTLTSEEIKDNLCDAVLQAANFSLVSEHRHGMNTQAFIVGTVVHTLVRTIAITMLFCLLMASLE